MASSLRHRLAASTLAALAVAAVLAARRRRPPERPRPGWRPLEG